LLEPLVIKLVSNAVSHSLAGTDVIVAVGGVDGSTGKITTLRHVANNCGSPNGGHPVRQAAALW